MKFNNLYEMFTYRAGQSANRGSYRFKDGKTWKSVTWSEFTVMVEAIAKNMLRMGLKKGSKVCILADTRPEWDQANSAILAIGAVTVGIYQTSTPEQVHYIIEHCDAEMAIVQDKNQLEKVLSFREQMPKLKKIVVLEATDTPEGEEFLSFAELLSPPADPNGMLMAAFEEAAAAVNPEDEATFIYTSGTTGPPKGAMLSHGNIMTEIELLLEAVSLDENDDSLIWLPNSHIFQRAATAAGMYMGLTGAYVESLDKILDNLKEIRPTVFYSVPRVYEKAYTKILGRVEDGSMLKKKLFYWALSVGRRASECKQRQDAMPPALAIQYALAKKLVFNKIKDVFGGRVKWVASSGAPISKELLEFFHAADILTLEAYGMTEATGAITVNSPWAYKFGTVGRPGKNIELKIAEDGEILAKGPVVFKGYYKEEALTRDSFTDDGFYKTGDVGHLDEDGFLVITDRKKDIIVTAGGKNVAPQNIENMLKGSPYISQAMVHGDKRAYLVCLITLDPDELANWATRQDLTAGDHAALCKEERVVRLIQDEVNNVNADLARYETIKKFRIIPDDFTEEAGELTPTMKLKRKVVTERYMKILDEMYS